MSAIHLANEIVESQKVRADLLKWKIIAIATLSTIGLGISTNFNKAELVLCTIPFISAYIDALCLHINLRIFSIGQWHKTAKAKEIEIDREYAYMKAYEDYTTRSWNCGAFNLQKWTIFYSSIIINVILCIVPLLELIASLYKRFDNYSPFFTYNIPLIISGTVGLILTIFLNNYLKSTKEKISKLE